MKNEKLEQTKEDICNRAENNGDYKCIHAFLSPLRNKMQVYQQLVATKNSTGKLGTIDRAKCKSELFEIFNDIFNALERNCNGDPDFITFLGLVLQTPTRKMKEPVVFGGKPTIKTAKNTYQVGQLQIELEPVSGVVVYGIEWSADGGVTRHNGQYSAEPNLTIKVAPHSEIMVWAFAVGNVDEKSEMSEPMIARSL
jgi:hypothetical protein